jgi:hypothetical protein
MSLINVFAAIAMLAGIGVLLNGALIHVGIILLIEGGVLLTLAEKRPKPGRRSKNPSA